MQDSISKTTPVPVRPLSQERISQVSFLGGDVGREDDKQRWQELTV